MMRVESNGADATRLASGDIVNQVCTPDGKYVDYADYSPPHTIGAGAALAGARV
jgi:hypothetical protein